VKDYREHAIATLFGQVMVRLPRFRCTACGAIEVGIESLSGYIPRSLLRSYYSGSTNTPQLAAGIFYWPLHCRSTPELDRVQAHLSALMTYRTAADVLEQMFPVGVGKDKETMRRHTLRAGAALRDCAAIEPETREAAIAVTLDSTFIRSCEDGASSGGTNWQC
jgi:hypothetical protein